MTAEATFVLGRNGMTVLRRNAATRLPRSFVVVVIALCATPLILSAFGVDFSFAVPDLPAPASTPEVLSQATAPDFIFAGLVHAIVESAAICAAVFTAILAWVYFLVRRNDAAIPIIGATLLCAASMDAIHVFTGPGFGGAVTANADYYSLTWSVSRLLTAAAFIVGVWIVARESKVSTWLRIALNLGVNLFFVAIALFAVNQASQSTSLPRTIFADALICRPFDFLAMLMFVFAGWLIYRRLHRLQASYFTHALLIAMLPQIMTQNHMAFGSTALFDNNFNIAHYLKCVAYCVPLCGLCFDYFYTHRSAEFMVQQIAEGVAQTGAIFDAAAESIITIDESGIIKSCNPATQEMFNYRQDELLGQNVSMLAAPPHGSSHDEYLANFMKTGVAKIIGFRRELEGRRKDGSTFPIELTVTEGRQVGKRFFTGFVRDITTRNMAKAAEVEHRREIEEANQSLAMVNLRLEERNEELDQFTFMASHDLQEPLRKLISFSELLRTDIGGDVPESAAKDLDFIEDAARRMSSLVKALLSLSRTGLAEIQQKTLALDTCVDEALYNLSAAIEEKGAQINRQKLPTIVGDDTLLTQIFQNLIGNALKFVAPDRAPQVDITGEDGEDEVTIRVKDNGIGLKPQYTRQIFVPFKRLNNRSRYEGTGIGLSICRKAVERHGGRIRVESAPGHGAEFIFTLKRVTEPATCPITKEPEPSYS